MCIRDSSITWSHEIGCSSRCSSTSPDHSAACSPWDNCEEWWVGSKQPSTAPPLCGTTSGSQSLHHICWTNDRCPHSKRGIVLEPGKDKNQLNAWKVYASRCWILTLMNLTWRERHGQTASAALRSLSQDIALRYPSFMGNPLTSLSSDCCWTNLVHAHFNVFNCWAVIPYVFLLSDPS